MTAGTAGTAPGAPRELAKDGLSDDVVPPALAADLARAYERTWGRWAALRTTEVGPRYLPAGDDDDEAGGT